MKYLLLIVLLVGVMMTAGCVSENKNTAFTPIQTATANYSTQTLQGSSPSVSPSISVKNAVQFQNPEKYAIEYVVRVINTGFEPEQIKVYQPKPVEWDSQKDVSIEEISPAPTKQPTDQIFGNGIYYWEMKNVPKIGESIDFSTKFTITAYEIKSNINAADVKPYNTGNPDYKLYTRSERFIEADNPKIIQLANQVAGAETNPFRIAHRYYDYIIDTYDYKLSGKGLSGAKSLMETGNGECGDYTALFVALCRSKGIPARPIVGYWAVSGIDQTHVWGEIFIEPFGWIPVDPIFGQLHKTMREYYFGNIDNRRVILNKNFNILLDPPSPDNSPAPFLQVPQFYYWGKGDTTKLTIERAKWIVTKKS